jgi:hypothetical protein
MAYTRPVRVGCSRYPEDREKGVVMKRIGLAVATAISFVLCVAAPAFAGSELPSGPDVEGAGGSAGGGGTAFTGANVSQGLLLLAVLVAVGMLALYASRRRSHSAS